MPRGDLETDALAHSWGAWAASCPACTKCRNTAAVWGGVASGSVSGTMDIARVGCAPAPTCVYCGRGVGMQKPKRLRHDIIIFIVI
eukprot:3252638-Pyramimonas_sp.AAC.1